MQAKCVFVWQSGLCPQVGSKGAADDRDVQEQKFSPCWILLCNNWQSPNLKEEQLPAPLGVVVFILFLIKCVFQWPREDL